MSAKEFQMHVLHVSNDVKDSNGNSCNALIVPAKFNPRRCVSDARHLEGDRN